jgi:hypothetical protein
VSLDPMFFRIDTSREFENCGERTLGGMKAKSSQGRRM